MTRSVLLCAILELVLMGASLPFVVSRRAVGKRQDGRAAVQDVVHVGVQRMMEDSDEWGDEDVDDGDDGDHGGSKMSASKTRGEAENSSKLPGGDCSSITDTNTGSCSFDDDVLQGPVPWSVVDRGLVTTEVSPASILKEHGAWHSEEKAKNFNGETLGYVTPWHGAGYDFARTFRSKLTYVSPVWYQLRGAGGSRSERTSFSLTGGHDFDEAWVSDVRNGVGVGGGWTATSDMDVTKIFPRVVLELQAGIQLSQADLRELAELLVVEAEQRGYDGYVLDIPLSDGIEEFVGGIKTAAVQKGINLLLIQSVRPGVSLSAHLRRRLVPLIHRFSLMTYDYRPPHTPTDSSRGERTAGEGVPNSPLSWVRECVEMFAPGGPGSELRSMTLIGLPFYGYDNGRATTSSDIVSLFAAEQPRDSGVTGREVSPISLEWDPVWREHVMSYRERGGNGNAMHDHVATFPTLAFIQERVLLAQQLGVGVALWELGQGMPYFFDLF
eukprot:g13822.t1